MVVNGYAIKYMYSGDGTLMIQVRIPSIHGPMSEREYDGKQVRNYTKEQDLPYYSSVLLPHLPTYGEVVALVPVNESNAEFMVMGLTGGSWYTNKTNKGG